MKPLLTFEELVNWNSNNANSYPINYQKPVFQEISGSLATEYASSCRSKVLFCHDMQGGYKDDVLHQKNEEVYAYRFYYWHLIDIFVYFSHHFITIPPTSWIYLSHRNGVQCLGTFIIEHDPQHKNLSCFLNLDNTKLVAQKLTEIKNFYNFDGWLINIEVKIQKSSVQNIQYFLKLLVNLGNEVHCRYDSITTSGDLLWQNGLTELNKPFFESCGNIFLNYCWNNETLEKSIEIANGKLHNIFVGIDCFGRGCHGGGGLQCNLALQFLKNIVKNNESRCSSTFSIALFAPGWCYESTMNKQQDLDSQTWSFYSSMEGYLHPYLDDRTIYRQLPELKINETDFFSTNFDIGQGFSEFSDGVEISKEPYNFLLDQNFIPTGILEKINTDLQIKILVDRTISFNGHSCMVITAFGTATEICSNEIVIIELFRLSCSISKVFDASLLLILGWNHETNIDIWNKIFFILHYYNEDKIQSVELALNTMEVPHSAIECNKVKWNSFKIKNLFSFLAISNDKFTVRKISLKITGSDIFNYLRNNKIYLGHLKLSC